MSQPVQLGRRKDEPPRTFVDPVCKMIVTLDSAAAEYDYKGEMYYFCMTGCRDRFAADPERYLSEPAAWAPFHESPDWSPVHAGGSDIEYTCPMHPQIVQIGPGSCPICGMALEPKIVTLEDLPDTEYL